jgi:hypothetical protein
MLFIFYIMGLIRELKEQVGVNWIHMVQDRNE